jgi:hypothetical protein
MRRLPSDFYRRLDEIREVFGENEYSRDDIRPTVIELIRECVPPGDNDLYKDAADEKLDAAEKSDDNASTGFFPYLAHVALGEKKRIRRGRMNREQMMRRKRMLDEIKRAQDIGWANETNWLNTGIDALEGYPSTTVREDVLREDGSAPPQA